MSSNYAWGYWTFEFQFKGLIEIGWKYEMVGSSCGGFVWLIIIFPFQDKLAYFTYSWIWCLKFLISLVIISTYDIGMWSSLNFSSSAVVTCMISHFQVHLWANQCCYFPKFINTYQSRFTVYSGLPPKRQKRLIILVLLTSKLYCYQVLL